MFAPNETWDGTGSGAVFKHSLVQRNGMNLLRRMTLSNTMKLLTPVAEVTMDFSIQCCVGVCIQFGMGKEMMGIFESLDGRMDGWMDGRTDGLAAKTRPTCARRGRSISKRETNVQFGVVWLQVILAIQFPIHIHCLSFWIRTIARRVEIHDTIAMGTPETS